MVAAGAAGVSGGIILGASLALMPSIWGPALVAVADLHDADYRDGFMRELAGAIVAALGTILLAGNALTYVLNVFPGAGCVANAAICVYYTRNIINEFDSIFRKGLFEHVAVEGAKALAFKIVGNIALPGLGDLLENVRFVKGHGDD